MRNTGHNCRRDSSVSVVSEKIPTIAVSGLNSQQGQEFLCDF